MHIHVLKRMSVIISFSFAGQYAIFPTTDGLRNSHQTVVVVTENTKIFIEHNFVTLEKKYSQYFYVKTLT